MASEKSKLARAYRPKKLSLESIELDEATPPKWGPAVKVSLRQLERFRAAYIKLEDDHWNLLKKQRLADKRSDEADKARKRRSDDKVRMLGLKRGREKNDEPFVKKQIFDEESAPIQEALLALYNVASSVHLRARCLEIIPVLKLVGSGKLWTLISAEILAAARFSPVTILYKVCGRLSLHR